MSDADLREFSRHVTDQIREEKRPIEEKILNGSCSDFADYKRMVGILNGLNQAEGVVATSVKTFNTDED